MSQARRSADPFKRLISSTEKRKEERLLDHLVGSGKQGRRHRETKHRGRPRIDDELKPACLHNREVGRPASGTLHMSGHLPIGLFE